MVTKFSDLDLGKSYTYGDYQNWFFEEQIELIYGKVYYKPTPLRVHQEVVRNLLFGAIDYFPRTKYKMFFAPFDVRFVGNEENVNHSKITLQPDLCIISDFGKLDEKGYIGAPDLVFEVLSKENTVRDLKEKFDIYEEFGVREYWIVDPINEHVFIYILNEEGKYIGLRPFVETEITSTIFPNFSITTEQIFSE